MITATGTKPITLDVLRTVYNGFVKTYTKGRDIVVEIAPNLDTLVKKHLNLERINQAREWAIRLGVRESGLAGQGAFFLNGAYFQFDQVSAKRIVIVRVIPTDVFVFFGAQELGQNLQRTMNVHFQFAQQKVYYDELTDDSAVENYFPSLPTVRPRRNRWIFPSDKHPLEVVNLVRMAGKELLGGLEYTYADGAEEVAVASMLVVTDLTAPGGIKLAQEALQFIVSQLVGTGILSVWSLIVDL